jgi:hypothetical protein
MVDSSPPLRVAADAGDSKLLRESKVFCQLIAIHRDQE